MSDIIKVLKAVSPSANAAFVAASGNAGAIMQEFGIKSQNAQAQLIGHMAVECAGFKTFAENLNYSAQRLTQVWPSRFPSLTAASPYAKNPKALANKVYNGRMGNRAGSNDGYDFRGSGGLQHTGRSEFERVERRTHLAVTTKPDMLRDPQWADPMWRAACSYFADRGCILAADRGDTLEVTKKVNGGTTGLADRKIMVQRASAALMGETIVVAEKTTRETADDTKRKATQATVGAPAGAGAGAGTSKGADSSHATAIAVGAIVFAVIVVVAIILWRKHAALKTVIETTELQAKADRIAVAT